MMRAGRMKHLLLSGLLCVSGAGSVWAQSTAEDGAALFADHCVACHGAGGRGDGPDAAGLDTTPADLTRIAARRDGVWPMLEVMSIIDGYTRRFTLRADMPVLPEITDGPVVDFDTGNGVVHKVPARLIAIANYLETLQSPRPTRYVP